MFERDVLEVFRQLRRGEGPWPTDRGRFEPSPGHEIEKRSGFTESKEIAFSIADPEQLRAGNRFILRLAFNQDHLRRIGRYINTRQGLDSGDRQTSAEILPLVGFR